MIPRWLLTRVLPGLLVAALLAFISYRLDAHGYNRAETKYKAEIAATALAQSKAQLAADKEAKDRYDAQSKNMLRLSESLIDANVKVDALTKQLNERAHDVSTQYRARPDADLLPVPDWIVTHGWVCDYNRAIGDGVLGTGPAVGGTENPSCAADAFVPSGVSAERILEHHEEYGAYCRKLEEQVNRLIDDREFIEQQYAAHGEAGK